MSENVFIDTNIFIYALTETERMEEKVKRAIAIDLFERIIDKNGVIVSTQVINEFYTNMLKKFSVSDEKVLQIVKDSISSIAQIKPVSFETCIKAYSVRNTYSLSFWDSMIVAAALENDCRILYSEDLQHGLVIDKQLAIDNPFYTENNAEK